ncbi:MAG: hypothetical protein ABIQ31_04540 [Ferruginibacter sp.]
MHNRILYRDISQAYLFTIPVLTALLGFTVHNLSYNIYLPIWIVNVILMLTASWILGAFVIKTGDEENKYFAVSGLLLIAPWLFFSIFAGMGSPPATYAEWVTRGFEQQLRYSFLIAGGVLLTFGFAVLREKNKATTGNIFSLIGFIAIIIAMSLFILNMSYWHSFLLETFKISQASSSNSLPEWHQPVRKLFLVVSIVDVSLTYLATAAFAAALKSAGWFKKGSSRIYITISLLAFVFVALYGFYPDVIITNGFPFYPFMIPAIPFVLPYYIGVNLLKRAGN